MNDTGERILQVSLRLFARDGYEAVSVSMIAAELGITKGALYRHYESKRAIFDAILRRMEQGDAEKAEESNVPADTAEEMPDAYTAVSVEDVIRFSREMYRYWTEDPFASCFRRMLTLEQYRNDEMRGLYRQYLSGGPLDYMMDLFRGMGVKEPERAANAFYGPMYLLYSVWDGTDDKEGVRRMAGAHFDRMEMMIREEIQ